MSHAGLPSRKPRSFAELTGVRYPQEMLPFVIPDLERDIKVGMAITMRRSLLSRDPLVQGMYEDARGYFGHLHEQVERIRAGDQLALLRAHQTANLPEVPEIGLGYSTAGRVGSGIGRGALNDSFVRTLLEYRGLSLALTEEPDTLFFFEGFGLDRVTDAFATIVKRRLILYTQKQMVRFRFDPNCIHPIPVRSIWNPAGLRTEEDTVELPVADDGRGIILVPKGLIRSAPPVQPHQYGRYYRLADKEWHELKRRIMEENRNSPERLLRLMRRIFDDPRRYQSRRDLREDGE